MEFSLPTSTDCYRQFFKRLDGNHGSCPITAQWTFRHLTPACPWLVLTNPISLADEILRGKLPTANSQLSLEI